MDRILSLSVPKEYQLVRVELMWLYLRQDSHYQGQRNLFVRFTSSWMNWQIMEPCYFVAVKGWTPYMGPSKDQADSHG